MVVAVAKVSPWSSAVWAAAAPALSPALIDEAEGDQQECEPPLSRETGDGRYGRYGR